MSDQLDEQATASEVERMSGEKHGVCRHFRSGIDGIPQTATFSNSGPLLCNARNVREVFLWLRSQQAQVPHPIVPEARVLLLH